MTHPSIDQLCDQIAATWPPDRFSQVTVLVGVSGGADSVCLLRCLHHLHSTQPNPAGRLVVGHLNHRLRGEASELDQQFVVTLAQKLGLEAIVESAAVPQAAMKSVSEDSLRELRYAFFERVADRVGARYIALAHTASDVTETFLHHLFRGTGPTGMSGIPAFRDLGPDLVVARPMIQAERVQILAALTAWQQPHRHDATNDTIDWNRNWIRNEVLPMLRDRYPKVDRAIPRAAELLTEQRDDLRAIARQWIADRVLREPHKLRIQLPAPPKTIFVTALMLLWDQFGWSRNRMSRIHWDVLWKMTQKGDPGFHNLPGDLRATLQIRNCPEKTSLHPNPNASARESADSNGPSPARSGWDQFLSSGFNSGSSGSTFDGQLVVERQRGGD